MDAFLRQEMQRLYCFSRNLLPLYGFLEFILISIPAFRDDLIVLPSFPPNSLREQRVISFPFSGSSPKHRFCLSVHNGTTPTYGTIRGRVHVGDN